MKKLLPLGTTHRAPSISCSIHAASGRRPFDSSPKRLTPSAHCTGSPTARFFSRIRVGNPAAVSARAAMPPAGPAPTMIASYTSSVDQGGGAISVLRLAQERRDTTSAP